MAARWHGQSLKSIVRSPETNRFRVHACPPTWIVGLRQREEHWLIDFDSGFNAVAGNSLGQNFSTSASVQAYLTCQRLGEDHLVTRIELVRKQMVEFVGAIEKSGARN